MAKIERMEPQSATVTVSYPEAEAIRKALAEYHGRPSEWEPIRNALRVFSALGNTKELMD